MTIKYCKQGSCVVFGSGKWDIGIGNMVIFHILPPPLHISSSVGHVPMWPLYNVHISAGLREIHTHLAFLYNSTIRQKIYFSTSRSWFRFRYYRNRSWSLLVFGWWETVNFYPGMNLMKSNRSSTNESRWWLSEASFLRLIYISLSLVPRPNASMSWVKKVVQFSPLEFKLETWNSLIENPSRSVVLCQQQKIKCCLFWNRGPTYYILLTISTLCRKFW